VLRTTRNAPTRDGGYLLLTYPGCTTLHTGSYRGDSVYVVGRNTEYEALFTRQQLAAATQLAIEHKLTIENIPATGLCDEAVISLFAGV
jgi:hypothetical protein